MRRSALKLCGMLVLALAGLSAGVIAQQKNTSAEKADTAKLPARIWRDPGDMASLDLFYGAGGKGHAPDPNGTFTFVKEDMQATSPKFDIEDGQGVKWKVKLGEEPESETAATRFLWAAGYFVDEDYYLAELKVIGVPKLQRGGNFVSADGTVRRVRLERKPKAVKKVGAWDWFDNPSRMEQVTKHIPRADAKWLGRRLSMLSEEQIRDGFRAAGYTPEEIEVYTEVVRERIAELDAL